MRVAFKSSAAFTIAAISVSIDHAEVLVPVPELAAETVIDKLHDCPPIEIAKAAVPAAEGVPVIAKVTEPAPETNVPAAKVAVRPVTPVEAIPEPAEYAAPFPPVYGTVAVPVNTVLAVGVVEKVAAEQLNAVMVGVVVVTTSVSSQATTANKEHTIILLKVFLKFINLNLV